MRKILLIPSSDYLGHPFPQRHNHIFERLHDHKDFEVHVIRFNMFKKPKLSTRCIVHEIPLEINIRNTALYYITNVVGYTNEIMRIIKKEAIDMVVAGNLLPPLTYSLATRLQNRNIPFIFDLQDYYPTSAAGYVAEINSMTGHIAKGLFEAITQHLIRLADVVIVPGIALALYAREIGAKKVEIIPNGISEYFLQKYNGKEIREKLGYNNESIVIGYIGSIEFWLDMEPLIKAISIMHEQKIPVRFLIIGKELHTQYFRKVEQWIKEYNVENITTWLNFIQYQDVPKYIAAMDIGTIPFDITNPTAYYAAPNKLWEYLSQGINVISTPIPEAYLYKNLISIVRSGNDYIRHFFMFLKHGKSGNKHKIDRIIKYRRWDNIAILVKKTLSML